MSNCVKIFMTLYLVIALLPPNKYKILNSNLGSKSVTLFTSEFFATFNSNRPWELELISILNVEFQTKEGSEFREMIKALTWQHGLDLFRELVQIVQMSLILNSSTAA